MGIEAIQHHLEQAIKRTSEEIAKKGARGDKLDSLAKLCNSYKKLCELAKAGEAPPNPGLPIYAEDARDEEKILHGDPDYHKSLFDPKFGKYQGKLARRKR